MKNVQNLPKDRPQNIPETPQWVKHLRNRFPLLQNRVNLVYLDSAATAQKPDVVIDAVKNFYTNTNANVHRGVYSLSQEATEVYESVRGKVAAFLGIQEQSEIIYTKGTTDSLNLVMRCWGEDNVQAGDHIVVTRLEHHANFVPWQVLAQRKNAHFHIVELTQDGELDIKERARLENLIEEKGGRFSLLAISHMSNVLGVRNDVADWALWAKKHGAVVTVDGAQSAAHGYMNLNQLGPIDFFAFSSHKIFGPSGIGVLWGRRQLLEKMSPYVFGGDMISLVTDEKSTWNELPWKFEAGTPAMESVVGMGAALDFIQNIGRERFSEYENILTSYALEQLKKIPEITVFGSQQAVNRAPVFSFALDGVHPHDLATFLDVEGIAVRAGHHCAQPLKTFLQQESTTRASFSVYNTIEDIDALVGALRKALKFFSGGRR